MVSFLPLYHEFKEGKRRILFHHVEKERKQKKDLRRTFYE